MPTLILVAAHSEVAEAEAEVQAILRDRLAAEQAAHEKRLRKEARVAEKRRCEAMMNADSCVQYCIGSLMSVLDAHIERRVAQPLFDCRAVLTGLGDRACACSFSRWAHCSLTVRQGRRSGLR